jgi:hypothetical protein
VVCTGDAADELAEENAADLEDTADDEDELDSSTGDAAALRLEAELTAARFVGGERDRDVADEDAEEVETVRVSIGVAERERDREAEEEGECWRLVPRLLAADEVVVAVVRGVDRAGGESSFE